MSAPTILIWTTLEWASNSWSGFPVVSTYRFGSLLSLPITLLCWISWRIKWSDRKVMVRCDALVRELIDNKLVLKWGMNNTSWSINCWFSLTTLEKYTGMEEWFGKRTLDLTIGCMGTNLLMSVQMCLEAPESTIQVLEDENRWSIDTEQQILDCK